MGLTPVSVSPSGPGQTGDGWWSHLHPSILSELIHPAAPWALALGPRPLHSCVLCPLCLQVAGVSSSSSRLKGRPFLTPHLPWPSRQASLFYFSAQQ